MKRAAGRIKLQFLPLGILLDVFPPTGVPDIGFIAPAGIPRISHLTLLRVMGDCDHSWISCLPSELESERTGRSARWGVELGCGHMTERQSRVQQTPSLLTKNEVKYYPVFGVVHFPQTSQFETENVIQSAKCLLIEDKALGPSHSTSL